MRTQDKFKDQPADDPIVALDHLVMNVVKSSAFGIRCAMRKWCEALRMACSSAHLRHRSIRTHRSSLDHSNIDAQRCAGPSGLLRSDWNRNLHCVPSICYRHRRDVSNKLASCACAPAMCETVSAPQSLHADIYMYRQMNAEHRPMLDSA